MYTSSMYALCQNQTLKKNQESNHQTAAPQLRQVPPDYFGDGGDVTEVFYATVVLCSDVPALLAAS